MDETWNWGVLFFTQGIESERRMIWNDATLEGNELKSDGIVKRVIPVDAREDVGRELDGHGCHFQCCFGFPNEVIFGANML